MAATVQIFKDNACGFAAWRSEAETQERAAAERRAEESLANDFERSVNASSFGVDGSGRMQTTRNR